MVKKYTHENGESVQLDGIWSLYLFQSTSTYLVNKLLTIVTMIITLLNNLHADLIAKTMYRLHMDVNVVSSTGIKSKAATVLPPTIASVPPPSTADLVRTHVSRKVMTAHEI